MRFNAEEPPVGTTELEDVIRWAHDHFLQVASMQQEWESDRQILKELHVEPTRPRDGMTAYVDGNDWDVKFGDGLHTFNGTDWEPNFPLGKNYGFYAWKSAAAVTGLAANTWNKLTSLDSAGLDKASSVDTSTGKFTLQSPEGSDDDGFWIISARVTFYDVGLTQLPDGALIGLAFSLFDSGGTAQLRFPEQSANGRVGAWITRGCWVVRTNDAANWDHWALETYSDQASYEINDVVITGVRVY